MLRTVVREVASIQLRRASLGPHDRVAVLVQDGGAVLVDHRDLAVHLGVAQAFGPVELVVGDDVGLGVHRQGAADGDLGEDGVVGGDDVLDRGLLVGEGRAGDAAEDGAEADHDREDGHEGEQLVGAQVEFDGGGLGGLGLGGVEDAHGGASLVSVGVRGAAWVLRRWRGVWGSAGSAPTGLGHASNAAGHHIRGTNDPAADGPSLWLARAVPRPRRRGDRCGPSSQPLRSWSSSSSWSGGVGPHLARERSGLRSRC
jgi:hypothetical protein